MGRAPAAVSMPRPARSPPERRAPRPPRSAASHRIPSIATGRSQPIPNRRTASWNRPGRL